MIRKTGPLGGAHLFREAVQKIDSLLLPACWLVAELAEPRALLAHSPPSVRMIVYVLPSIAPDRNVSATLPPTAVADTPLPELLGQAQFSLADRVLFSLRIPKQAALSEPLELDIGHVVTDYGPTEVSARLVLVLSAATK